MRPWFLVRRRNVHRRLLSACWVIWLVVVMKAHSSTVYSAAGIAGLGGVPLGSSVGRRGPQPFADGLELVRRDRLDPVALR